MDAIFSTFQTWIMIPIELHHAIPPCVPYLTASVRRTVPRYPAISHSRMYLRWSQSPSTTPSTTTTLASIKRSLTASARTQTAATSRRPSSCRINTPTIPRFRRCIEKAMRLPSIQSRKNWLLLILSFLSFTCHLENFAPIFFAKLPRRDSFVCKVPEEQVHEFVNWRTSSQVHLFLQCVMSCRSWP